MSIWIMPLLAGPFVGSFIGVLVLRLPAGDAVVFGRSACRYCSRQLGARDLAPLLSWVCNRGRCRYCGERIGLFYPLIELAALGVAVWSVSILSGWLLWATCLLGWLLLALAVMDWRAFVLSDALTLSLVPTGLAVAHLVEPTVLAEHLIGALAGYLAFAGLASAYRYVRGRDGLGMGDAKLLAGAGAWVSWSGLPSVVLLAALCALSAVLAKSLAGGSISAMDRVPFGSYLALGTWLVWLYGPVSL
ncbi:A24 family peptidase [Rhodospirillaceae bacterium SYSU D60014]|uniref:prepilin peptidase n=1 Tax=Virgifigura deserti TaxID=2268457 RepID=UPI000E661FAF